MHEGEYTGPALDLKFRLASDGGFTWEVSILAIGADGNRLGYSARGALESLSDEPGSFDLKVRDLKHETWTTMPPNHREDVRAAISNLIGHSAAVLATSAGK